MAAPLRTLIILGSGREGRTALPVGRWVLEQAASRPDLACELVDLKDWNLPFYPFAKQPAAGNYTDPLQLKWAGKIASPMHSLWRRRLYSVRIFLPIGA